MTDSQLTTAEQAAAEALQREYLDGAFDPAADDIDEGVAIAARVVVAAVRPIIEAKALDDAAEALAEVAAVTAREPYVTSQRLRFGLTSGAQRLRDRAEAARQSGEGRADG